METLSLFFVIGFITFLCTMVVSSIYTIAESKPLLHIFLIAIVFFIGSAINAVALIDMFLIGVK